MPLFWWCKVSLHLVRVTHTHMTVGLGPLALDEGGVRFFLSFSMCAWWQGKAKTASSKEREAWGGGVSAKGCAWITWFRDGEHVFFHWDLWRISAFPSPVQPSHHTPLKAPPYTHRHPISKPLLTTLTLLTQVAQPKFRAHLLPAGWVLSFVVCNRERGGEGVQSELWCVTPLACDLK